MMYAVFKTGGKQYRVAEGEIVKLEKLATDVGKAVNFDQVLLIADDKKTVVGDPYVKKAKVSAEVLTHGRHRKINILKFKRRKHHLKRMGHRQDFTEVKITAIKGTT